MTLHILAPAPRPCLSCPYKQSVPSGIWTADEYRKLPRYDLPIAEQPTGTFLCHRGNRRVCGGWAGCHDMAENLAVRVAVSWRQMTLRTFETLQTYTTPEPLFATGAEACAHGLRDIHRPGPAADRLRLKLLRQGKVLG